VDDVVRRTASDESAPLIRSSLFSRSRHDLPGMGTLLRDDFPDSGGASCVFIRIRPDDHGSIRFTMTGDRRISTCPAGGWLLESESDAQPSYWIPQRPALRSFDAHGRILAEEPAAITSFGASPGELSVTVTTSRTLELGWAVWCIPSGARRLGDELKRLRSLETHPAFLWSSQSVFRSPADLYVHLVNGHVYQNARAWPRKWKFCCELDAYELFVWMSGLEQATGKSLYNLLRRQLLLAVISRQSDDGGWYHGEWTDLKECHYRFHNGALQLLENALDEWDDEVVRASLVRGAAFVASRTDHTDIGLWFMHDSLEGNPDSMDEMQRQTGSIVKGFGAWRPTFMLGKSATNKMILNTHVDTTVTLDRYRSVTGDERFGATVDSARSATRRILALRPAEPLYRLAYRAVGWTLLPASEAERLPLPVRALKRLTWMHLVPRLYVLKHRFPRIVMPGGFIDRHLAPMHFDAKYHAVNILDLARQQRRFPDDRLEAVIDGAVHFVVQDNYSMMRWWAEAHPRRFAIVVFAEALYHLCMLTPEPRYRRHLAEALLLIDRLRLGLPPSLLGGNAEISNRRRRVPCPSPARPALRVVNLCDGDRVEILVVNPSDQELPLEWETPPRGNLVWALQSDRRTAPGELQVSVPPGGWLWGRPHEAQ